LLPSMDWSISSCRWALRDFLSKETKRNTVCSVMSRNTLGFSSNFDFPGLLPCC
jgi:hypothetical protein